MVQVEVVNRSGTDVAEDEAVLLARHVLASEGIEDGELGLAFVGPDEIRRLKREHLGIDERTDVLSFPIDGRDDVPAGVPRQLGDAVLCPQVAAGAVLIATMNAVAVGYLVFAGKAADKTARVLDKLKNAPAKVTLIALVLTIFVVIATKAYTGRGTPLRGGLPSGHSAIGFAIW